MSETLLTPAPVVNEPAPQNNEPAPVANEPIIQPGAESDWSKALNADGTFTDDARGYGVPEQFKSVGGLMESYKNIQRLKGALDSEATPEQIQAYRESHGVPANANLEAYGITIPENLKDHYSDESLNRVVKAANDVSHLGHSAVLQAVFSEFTAVEMEGLQAQSAQSEIAQQAQLQASQEMLDKDPNFQGDKRAGSLQTTANALNAALGALGVESNSPEAKELARNPLMVRILHHYGSKTSQDSINLGHSNTDLRSGQEQADDIITNPNNPEYDSYHSGDARVGKKVLGLMGG